jgi:hypothetical protein
VLRKRRRTGDVPVTWDEHAGHARDDIWSHPPEQRQPTLRPVAA